MSFNNWIQNKIPANGSESIYELKEMLKTAGWTVKESSDGTTYNNSGDIISSASTGTNGFNNNYAWFRIANPADTSELCIQRGTDARYYWIKYSPSAKFVTGSPDATTTPTASDDENIFGTDSSGNTLFDSSSEGFCVLQGGANNSDCYGFWMAQYTFNTETPKTRTVFLMESLENTDSLDTDTGKQSLFFANKTSGGDDAFKSDYLNSDYFLGYLPTWTTMTGSYIQTSLYPAFPNAGYSGNYLGIGSNPHSQKDDRSPIVFVRSSIQAPPNGYKGTSSMLAWEGVTRTTGQTKGAKTRIVFGNISLPWDGTTVPKV